MPDRCSAATLRDQGDLAGKHGFKEVWKAVTSPPSTLTGPQIPSFTPPRGRWAREDRPVHRPVLCPLAQAVPHPFPVPTVTTETITGMCPPPGSHTIDFDFIPRGTRRPAPLPNPPCLSGAMLRAQTARCGYATDPRTCVCLTSPRVKPHQLIRFEIQ